MRSAKPSIFMDGVLATVFTDASYDPRHKVGAYAAWSKFRGDTIKRIEVFDPHTVRTSIEAEITAAAYGLQWVNSQFQDARQLVLVCDCKAVVDIINSGHLPKRAKTRSVQFMTAWNILDGLRQRGIRLKSNHIKAHGPTNAPRDFVNKWVDTAARKAMRNVREGYQAQ